MGSIYPPARYKKHPQQIEASIHKRVCSYLRSEYPQVIFRTDGGGLKLSKTQAIAYASMQSHNGWPDLQILAARRGYKGLFIELKKDGTAIYLSTGKDKGKLVNSKHIQNQAATLRTLNKNGYIAMFAVGHDKAIAILEWYFERPKNLSIF